MSEEVVETCVDVDRELSVGVVAEELNAGGLILLLIPLAFVVLLEEVAVTDPADFTGELPAAIEPMAMLAEHAVAEVLFERDGATILPEVIEPIVVDAPRVDLALVGTRNAEQVAAFVGVERAQSESAFGHRVEDQVPLGSLRLITNAEQLVHVPVGQDLSAEDTVVLDGDLFEVVRGIGQVVTQHGPIEDGEALDVDEVVAAFGQVLVPCERHTGLLIVGAASGERIDLRDLLVANLDIAGLDPVHRVTEAARGDGRVVGSKRLFVDLLQDVGLESQQAVVAIDGREDLGVENRASFEVGVVVHVVGVDDSLARDENDIAFEVELPPLASEITGGRFDEVGEGACPGDASVGHQHDLVDTGEGSGGRIEGGATERDADAVVDEPGLFVAVGIGVGLDIRSASIASGERDGGFEHLIVGRRGGSHEIGGWSAR